MTINESFFDRWLRVMIGGIITSFAFWGPETPWAYLGLIPVLTGVIGFCPLYALFGVSTCSVSSRRA